jgi:hypothetical protein
MAKRREMKMSDLIDHYEKVGCVIQRGKLQGVPMKPRTKKLTMARLRHHVVPLLGARPTNFTRRRISAVIQMCDEQDISSLGRRSDLAAAAFDPGFGAFRAHGALCT